jgi:uncharacterized protein YcfJ
MKSKIIMAAIAASLTIPAAMPAPAFAKQRHGYNRHQVYHGSNHRYRCKRSSGTTGLVAGAVGGGLVGNALGGGTLGTLVGAGGGALLGRHLDKRHDAAQNRRNGC